jgi:hypothetical protein
MSEPETLICSNGHVFDADKAQSKPGDPLIGTIPVLVCPECGDDNLDDHDHIEEDTST